MNAKLQAEIDKQAAAFGVTADAILGRDRSRAASAARRAVWAALMTRHAGGEFPAPKLAEIFGRQAPVVRAGAEMHRRKLLRWPRRMPAADEAARQRELARLRKRYARLSKTDPQRAAIRAECARLAALQKDVTA